MNLYMWTFWLTLYGPSALRTDRVQDFWEIYWDMLEPGRARKNNK